MRRMILPAAFALSLLCSCFAALPASAGGPEWRGWNEGLAQARSAQKPVIVDVYTDWCGWCRRMDRDVYASAEVTDYLRQRFVTIKINAESPEAADYEGKHTDSRGIAQRFRISGYPTTVFLRANGEHMANVPGYVPADKFLLLLRYVAEGHADRNEPFTEFEKSVQAESGRR